ncbi:NAD(P)/FAD-dependent oxidoreductase [Paenibacillus camelliae]|nr:NAD(P)/FAD-dependent oxidoreductase [Paenibacillus camelliae]
MFGFTIHVEVKIMIQAYDVIIIGAGQAGLAAAYYMQQAGIRYVVLGKEKRIGDNWRQRYDSLILFTPRWYSQLPGLPLDGSPHQYPSKDEIADYLERYSVQFQLNIELDIGVESLTKEANQFLLDTSRGRLVAKQVIVATGPFHKPYLPTFSSEVDPDIYQLHTSQYRSPSDLKPGPVLIVGGGNSGAQLAVELSEDREVTLSTNRKLLFFPLQIGKRSIFWWLHRLGLLRASADSLFGRWLISKGDPVFGTELKQALMCGIVQLKPQTVAVHNGQIVFADQSKLHVKNIVWATGFRADYSWIKLPQVVDDAGKLLHVKGVTPVEGLYVLGLPWQSHRGSALIGGVGRDASYLYSVIASRL